MSCGHRTALPYRLFANVPAGPGEMRRSSQSREPAPTREVPHDSWLRTVLLVLLVFGVILFCALLMTYSHLLSGAGC
jgi:hypothetical protein